jgi:hypothetical protein
MHAEMRVTGFYPYPVGGSLGYGRDYGGLRWFTYGVSADSGGS